MLKKFLVLCALAVGSASLAHADSISGYFSANGTDSFTSSTITFNSAQVAGAIGGTFASYLTDGDTITFLAGALPYNQGTNTPPNPPYTNGYVPLFSVTGNGVTFTYNMQQYDAAYITDGSSGCTIGSTCLVATGSGFFTATGAITGTSGLATFLFTSQYVPGQPLATLTTFSASASATASPIPEPESLALVGSGFVGLIAFARRRLCI